MLQHRAKKWQRMEMENVQQGKRTIKYNQAYTIFIIFIYHHEKNIKNIQNIYI